jgi:hypothetical protein
MANNVWTTINIEGGTPETMKKVAELFEHEKGGKSSDMDSEWLCRTIYEDYEPTRSWMHENMGPKWIYVEDLMIFEDYIEFSTQSAWDYPDIYLKKLLETVLKIDEAITIRAQFDDEMPNFVGAAYGNKNGYYDLFDHDVERPSEEDFEDEEGEIDYDAHDEAVEKYDYELDEIKDDLLSECQTALSDKVITEAEE